LSARRFRILHLKHFIRAGWRDGFHAAGADRAAADESTRYVESRRMLEELVCACGQKYRVDSAKHARILCRACGQLVRRPAKPISEPEPDSEPDPEQEPDPEPDEPPEPIEEGPRTNRRPRPDASDSGTAVANRFRTSANLWVAIGVATMSYGGWFAQQNADKLLFGCIYWFCGWAVLIWGCVNYARWKGYPGWFGLFGYLHLPGLIVLACLPNRRYRKPRKKKPGASSSELKSFPDDRRPGSRYLLALAPFLVAVTLILWFVKSVSSNISAAEWKEVAPEGDNFRIFMPGTAQRIEQAQPTPGGDAVLHKFVVTPKGRNEQFMIVLIRLPEGAVEQLGGREKLLELGRQDILAACKGQLQKTRRIVPGGYAGLEVEATPATGGVVKARIFATNSQIFEIAVQVPKLRAESDDVQRFFNSFQMITEAGGR
jgi:hypothetical protein